MINIGRQYRQIIINHIKQNLEKVNALYIVHYKGLAAMELDILRRQLRHVNSRLFVTKDTLGKLVLKELNWYNLVNTIEGPVAFVFVKSDPIVTSRILVSFAKEHTNLTLGGGILKSRLLTKDDFAILACLPSQHALLAKVAGGIKSPLVSFAMMLSQNLQKVVLVLKAIIKEKGLNSHK